MFIQFLEKLSQIKIPINGRIEEDGDQLINTIIFGNNFSGDVFLYKRFFFSKLRKKESALLRIQSDIYKSELSKNHRDILIQEIENKLLKLEFLRYIYNTEAQKINPEVQVHYPYSIEIYNKAFFGVSKKDVGNFPEITYCRSFENIFSKSDIMRLIRHSKVLCPEMKFKFGKYPGFSHNAGLLKIPNQKFYNVQNIITLFFHEATHFFRTYNGERNLGFAYQFAGYSTLEEGIAIYNEYFYGNKICNYGKFVPYYNKCIQVLLQDISQEEKKEQIIKILGCKGFNRDRSLQYYNRFYKYCQFDGTHIFLKDLIYYNGYKNVSKLIKKDPKNYEKIMAGDIGLQELRKELVQPNNNFDHKKYFSSMLKIIKNLYREKINL